MYQAFFYIIMSIFPDNLEKKILANVGALRIRFFFLFPVCTEVLFFTQKLGEILISTFNKICNVLLIKVLENYYSD